LLGIGIATRHGGDPARLPRQKSSGTVKGTAMKKDDTKKAAKKKKEAKKKLQAAKKKLLEKWRWEFMRRNPEYQEAYGHALKLRKQCQDSYEPEESKLDDRPEKILKIGKYETFPYFSSPWGEQEQLLCQKVGHFGSCMTNPEKDYKTIMKSKGMERAGFFPATKYDHFASYHINGSKLSVEFDLERINSFDALPEAAKDYVFFVTKNLLHTKILRNHFEPGGKALRNNKDYARILKVGALRAKNMTFRQIAQRLFPDDFIDHFNERSNKSKPESAERRCQQDSDEFDRLVTGGYHEITFP
jgi:hypothetical protein